MTMYAISLQSRALKCFKKLFSALLSYKSIQSSELQYLIAELAIIICTRLNDGVFY